MIAGRWRRVAGWIAVALAPLLAPSGAQAVQEPDDARLRRAWSTLDAAEQADALEQFEAEAEYVESFTAQLVKFALALDERDPGLFAEEPPTPVFDPVVHAPAQPIARRALEPDSAAAQSARKRILGRVSTRRLRSGWRYDYAARDVVRVRDHAALERRFENALAGARPLQDLAEALVERALDDGEQSKALGAFAHAYTDRTGNVYPGITLYDAWSSGAEIEMPDVDVLGIVHDVLGERSKWKAPVPDSQHKALYQRVGEVFQDARRHRGLRAALARSYLNGASELEPLYGVCVERLHFAWDEHQSDPRELAKKLPAPNKWNEHLAGLEKRMLTAKDGLARARTRIETLARDAAQLRASLTAILRERGAFERADKLQDR